MTGPWDVVIIGAGPAGSAAAIRTRALGLNPLVLEAERFPREHVGESLVGLWPLFELLGVAGEMDATFQHKHGSCRIWGEEPVLKWTTFGSLATDKTYSLQVERAAFDRILLDRALELGASVRQGHRVLGLLWDGERAIGVRYRDPGGTAGEAFAPWVIDASGRHGLIARHQRLRRIDPFYPDLSVYGYFRNAKRFPAEAGGNLLIEAVPWGWLWFIPLHNGEVSVGLVCDGSTRTLLKQMTPAGYLRAAVAQSSVVRQHLAGATLTRGPQVTASYGYESASYAGPGWILAGDAAAFVDPMWATGVANAVTDGISAAALVEAVLAGRVSEARATAYRSAELHARSNFTLDLVKFVYQANRLHADQPFWARRHAPDAGSKVPADQIMRCLSHHPSARYFLEAFDGMGISREVLAPIDRHLGQSGQRHARAGRLLVNPRGWRPRLRTTKKLRPWLGLDGSYRLVEGVTVGAHFEIEFIFDRLAAKALREADGRRTAQQIVDQIASDAQEGRQLRTRFELLATLADAHERDLLELEPA